MSSLIKVDIIETKMFKNKGYKAYKQHWEGQAGFMDKPAWDQDKISKLTISIDFGLNLKELEFSNHLLKKENGKHTLRIKVPYNYYDFDEFKSKWLVSLCIPEDWHTDISLNNSHCSNR